MHLWQNKISKTYFLHNSEGDHPKNTSVSEPLRSWPLAFQTLTNTITLFIVKSVAGIATDLSLNYAKFAPLNVWNFAALRVFIMLRKLCSLKYFEQCINNGTMTSFTQQSTLGRSTQITEIIKGGQYTLGDRNWAIFCSAGTGFQEKKIMTNNEIFGHES